MSEDTLPLMKLSGHVGMVKVDVKKWRYSWAVAGPEFWLPRRYDEEQTIKARGRVRRRQNTVRFDHESSAEEYRDLLKQHVATLHAKTMEERSA